MKLQDFIANIESSRIQNVSGNLFLCTPFIFLNHIDITDMSIAMW